MITERPDSAPGRLVTGYALAERVDICSILSLEKTITNRKPCILITNPTTESLKANLKPFKLPVGNQEIPIKHTGYTLDGRTIIFHWASVDPLVDEDGIRYLPPEAEYKLLSGRKYAPLFPDNLPDIPIAIELPWEHDRIESAVAQALHIVDNYNPRSGQTKKIKAIISFSDCASAQFSVQRNLGKADLQLLSRQVEALFKNIKWGTPVDRRKMIVQKRLELASELDALGRPNWAGLLLRLRSASWMANERLAIELLAEKKYEDIASALSMERIETRWVLCSALEQTYQLSDELIGRVEPKNSPKLMKLVDQIGSGLDAVSCQPYLTPARYTAVRLRGFKEPEKEQDMLLFGSVYYQELRGKPTVAQMLECGNYQEASEEITFCLAQLRTVLSQHASIWQSS